MTDSWTAPLKAIAALILLLAFLLAVRLLSFSDVYDNAQPGPMAHTVDVAMNGRWLMQREPSGELATKPPMYPWLAALGVMATGRTDEWVLKLPSIVAFLLVTVLVFDLGRGSMGVMGGIVAAVMWAANYHVFKLMYTARPDMLLALFVVTGLWSVQMQRRLWVEPAGTRVAGGATRHMIGLVVLFWLAVAAGLLTKGPPALLAVAWLLLSVICDKAWRRFRPGLQFAGLMGAIALSLAWLLPVLITYPQWMGNINREVVERISGTGSGANRDTPVSAIPLYFLGRFAPWSLLCVLAAITFRKWEPGLRQSISPKNVRWTFWWIGMVVVIFMIPRGKRADYILSAYVGGAVLAAAMIDQARHAGDVVRSLVGLFLGAIGVAGIGGFIACWLVPLPQTVLLEPAGLPIPVGLIKALIISCGVLLLAVGAINLALSHHQLYRAKAIAAAFVIAGTLGLYQCAFNRSAETRAGDYIHAVVDEAGQYSLSDGLPLVYCDIDKTPVQSLLGDNTVADETAMDRVQSSGAILVVSHRAWQQHVETFAGRYELMMRTPTLPESKIQLMLVRIRAPGSTATADNAHQNILGSSLSTSGK